MTLWTQAAAAVAEKIVKSVTKIGNVLAKSMKVGAPPVKVDLPTMAMDVRKSTAESLTEQEVESSIGSCKIDGVLDVGDDGCVAAQVDILLFNSKKLII